MSPPAKVHIAFTLYTRSDGKQEIALAAFAQRPQAVAEAEAMARAFPHDDVTVLTLDVRP